MRGLAQIVGERLLASRCGQLRSQFDGCEIWSQRDIQCHLTYRDNRLTQVSRQRIDRAAFDPRPGDHGFAADLALSERQRDALQRMAFETIPENLRPADRETAIRRP